jgi:magnesium transporter
MREVVALLQRTENDLIQEKTKIFLRDVYDHAIQAVDTMEVYRDMVASIMDLYLSSLSHKMNSAVKVLTVISTIFMPLGFIASVFGMNFKHFPETDMTWMYPYGFWGLIAMISGSMLYMFKRNRWI